MSKKSCVKVDHILRKYPELLNSYDTLDNSGIYKTGRILRKHMVKNKMKRTKKLPKLRTKKLDSKNGTFFTCPMCRNILETPVTVTCGHTFCKDCLHIVHFGKCSECKTELGAFLRTNILIQDILDKLKKFEEDSKICTRLDPVPRYSLRSNCNGQHVETVHEIENHQKEYSWNELTGTDFECILCSQCLLEPVTTTCGHTFCRECLTRVLDHGLACPLCMYPLKTSEQYRGENLVLSHALRSLASDEWQERLTINRQVLDKLEKNNQIPIFICTSAFPKVACPLFVYEPRYRLLARRCLQSSTKRFGMAAKTNDGDKFSWFGTMLEIRDCVCLSNGTSILTTIGLRRFRVLSRGEQDGYDTAVVQYISDRIVSSEQLPELIHLHERVHSKTIRWLTTLKSRLLGEIVRYIGHMPVLEEDWVTLPDGPSWTWWLVAILPLSLQLRVGFLAGTSLEKRLLAIEKMLDHLKIRMKAVERQSFNCNSNEMSNESCSHTERSVTIHHQNN